MKRIFDIVLSALGLFALSPLFIAVAVLIRLHDSGPVFFRQERVGKGFRPFFIYKFRTMITNAADKGPKITVGGDARITGIGKILRKYKIDELPQLINVFKGEMSFVGPRPEVKKYVETYRADYEKLLRLRPGITDPASINYSMEEEMLGRSKEDWEDLYVKRILPEKIRLSLRYAEHPGLFADVRIILETIFKISHAAEKLQGRKPGLPAVHNK